MIATGIISMAGYNTIRGNGLYTTTTSPQNLFQRSEEADNAYWTKLNSSTVTANTTTAPDSTTTADTYTAANASFGGIFRRSYTFWAQEYTASMYVKKINHDYIGMRIAGSVSGNNDPFFNLANGTTNTNSVAGVTLNMETLANGWYRISITYTPTAGISNWDMAICNSSGNTGITPAGTEAVYIWGMQLNIGPLRAYTKTVASIVP